MKINRILAAALLLCLGACAFLSGGNLATPVPPQETAVLYQDDFSNPRSGWDQAVAGGNSTNYSDGKYRIAIETPQQDIWANPYQYFDMDIVVDVDIEQAGGTTDSNFGLICGYTDTGNFYALTVGGKGFVEIFKYASGVRTTLFRAEGIQDVSPDANHLTARCVGSTLTLLVNGTELVQVDTGSLVRGDVGLIAGTFDQGNVEFLFDNLVVTAAN